MRQYAVYILASNSRVLYIGVTSNSRKRTWEHRAKFVAGFTMRYKVDQLVHFELYNEVTTALEREKHLKDWLRRKRSR